MEIKSENQDFLPKQKKTADKQKYIREYMKKRYEDDTEGARAYARSIKYKQKHNISDEEFKKYGRYLCDVEKLKMIKARIPIELFNEVCNETLQKEKSE